MGAQEVTKTIRSFYFRKGNFEMTKSGDKILETALEQFREIAANLTSTESES